MAFELIKENDIGKTYDTGKMKILYRIKDSVAGDNSVNPEELIYFITGSVEVTLRDETWQVEAPAEVHFPAKTYHKIKALTDISFVVFEK